SEAVKNIDRLDFRKISCRAPAWVAGDPRFSRAAGSSGQTDLRQRVSQMTSCKLYFSRNLGCGDVEWPESRHFALADPPAQHSIAGEVDGWEHFRRCLTD